ncbi:MAG: response regulator transcription factor [Erysipelotrichaceae bacterium]|nr:response regulator transcription factor [Erysipelotrichaceae bacterium]
MVRILLAEDDKDLNEQVTAYLKLEGFEVDYVFNGLDALNKIYENKYDIILSDIMMPLCDGYELAKSIREENKSIPIIFMSARDDKPSKQIGYKVGIDDYITKPFDLDELVFKIKAIARRIEINTSNLINIGNFKMDKDEHTAYVDDNELSLTVREFDILYALLSNPKKTFTRSKLMEEFWDYDSSATSRTVDVYLSKLRDKTKNCDGFEIQTVHGLGYKVVLK